MPELVKAKLTEISADPASPRDLSPPMDVQFNPASLRLALANQVEGGGAQTRPQRQYLGSGSRTLTLDLVFDTADEGTTGAPVSVRERTALVERFALPRAIGNDKQAPPKARFEWGPLVIEGVVEGVNIDLDHFAADGTPLRAKVSLTIKEQDARFALLESGAGANAAGNAPTPTAAASGAPGTSGAGTDRVGTALAGESAADFAARMGLDPGAWRGLAAGLDATLSLEAGIEIGFSASLGVGLGIGLSGGFSAGLGLGIGGVSTAIGGGLSGSLDLGLGGGLGLDLSAGGQVTGGFGVGLDLGGGFGGELGGGPGGQGSLGIGARAGVQSGASAARGAGPSRPGQPAAAGFALSAAGGVGLAIEQVKTTRAEAGQASARAAFADTRAALPSAPSAGGLGAIGSNLSSRGLAGTSTNGIGAGSGPLIAPAVTVGAVATAPAAVRPAMPDQTRSPLSRTGLPGPATLAAPAPRPPRADPRAVSFGLGVPLRPSYGEAARRRSQGDLGLPPTTDDPQVPRWRALPVTTAAAASGARSGVVAPDCACHCPPTKWTRATSRSGPGR